MAQAKLVEDELSGFRPQRRSDARITPGFNAALIAFVSVVGMLNFLVSDRARGVPIEGVLLSSLIDMVRFVLMEMIAAAFLWAFWSRLVVRLVPVRSIHFGESLAIVLMASLLGGR